MFLKSTSINHDAETLDQALNLSTTELYRCRERVFFATIANALQRVDLYEDSEDCPREFRTKTGDLSRTLSLISNPLEYEYTLLVFTRLQDLTQDTVAKSLALNDDRMSKGSRAKLQLMINLADMVMEHQLSSDDTDDEETDNENSSDRQPITPGMLFKRIDLVKKAHYSWDTYYNMIKAKNFYYPKNGVSTGSDFDIDDMLNNLFNKDGE